MSEPRRDAGSIGRIDNINTRLIQARGVLAALLADMSDLEQGSGLSTEMQSNALWAVDSLVEQAQEGVDRLLTVRPADSKSARNEI